MEMTDQLVAKYAHEPIELPFRFHANPGADEARVRNREWIRSRRLTISDEAFDWYCAWDLEKFVGNAYPHASSAGLDLCNKVLSWGVIFDDQFEGKRPGGGRSGIAEFKPFLDVLYDPDHVPDGASVLVASFAELWRDSTAMMSTSWRVRAAQHWQRYFCAVLNETVDSDADGDPLPMDHFLELRRFTGAMPVLLDAIELGAHFEVPEASVYAPSIWAMRQIVVMNSNFINDVQSLDKELLQGHTDNLVLVIKHQQECPLDEAVRLAVEHIEAEANRFLELRQEIPSICDRLGLDDQDRQATETYVDALEMWLAGYLRWHETTPRYSDALRRRPPGETWAYEDLLSSRA